MANTTAYNELINRAERAAENIEKNFLRIPAKLNKDKAKYTLFMEILDEVEKIKTMIGQYRTL